ncbi:DNA topoisomerase [Vibrio fortis]|uniref:DNA topoisomerase n=1 Tax=Vibrio fortis TaxID=212667 RepID=UPI004068BFB8
MKQLFIAEKPAVGRLLGDIFGVRNRTAHSIYCDNDIVVTWVVGHILELAEPADYGEQYKKWDLNTLPIIPNPFKLIPVRDKVINGKKQDYSGKRRQLKAIELLLKEAEEVVLATDPDAEGEILGREVIEFLNYHGKVSRVLPNSLEIDDLRVTVQKIIPASETALIAEAGLARSHIDWLMGINSTRGLTSYNRNKIDSVLNSGRVQGAIVRILNDNRISRANFRAQKTFSILADVVLNGEVVRMKVVPTPEEAKYLDPKSNDYCEKKALEVANNILVSIKGKQGKVTVCEKSEKSSKCKIGHKLTDLQVELSNKFNVGAQDTLNAVQSLYDKQQLTYPRTDNGYFPEKAHEYSGSVLEHLAGSFPEIAKRDDIDPNKKTKTWDTSKFENHHGIMPTRKAVKPSELSKTESHVYQAVATRYVMQFLPEYTYYKTEIEVDVDGRILKTSGNVPINLGWKALEKSTDEEDKENQSLPLVDVGSDISDIKGRLKEGKTTKPALFTEARLISTLTEAHRLLEDKELAKVMKEREKGIGRQSTTSAILSQMFYRGIYKLEKKKYIELTPKGTTIAEVSPDLMMDLALTAKLELSFAQIESGELTYDQLMAEYHQNVRSIIDDIKAGKCEVKNSLIKTFPCLKCDGEVTARKRRTDGKPFWICGKCEEKFPDQNGRPREKAVGVACPSCKEGKAFPFEFKLSNGVKGFMCSGCKVVFGEKDGVIDPTLHKCKKCESPLNKLYSKKSKSHFYGCSNDKCDQIYRVKDGSPHYDYEPAPVSDKPCPKCGGALSKRKFGDNVVWTCGNWAKKGLFCSMRFDDIDGKPNVDRKIIDCPKCKGGELVLRGKGDKQFFGCTNWNHKSAACSAKYDVKDGKPDFDKKEFNCPKCKSGVLSMRKTSKGNAWGCSNWNRKRKPCKGFYDDKNGEPDLKSS